MTADPTLLARLRTEVEQATTLTAAREVGGHIFRDYFRGLISEPEADLLRAKLAKRVSC